MKNTLRKMVGRRSFLSSAAGIGAAGILADDSLSAYQSNVNTNSRPSDLKITDMRVATVLARR